MRLVVDRRLIAVIREHRRRKDAARIAVDAGRVDEEIAGNVGFEPERELRHTQ
jgi:hypothetical protein